MAHRQNRPDLSVIPDLRYEYSYLKNISRYVHLERIIEDASPSSRRSEEKLLEGYEDLEPREERPPAEQNTIPLELVHVQWNKVFWLTTRDQIITPFLQGALWGIASFYLTPVSRQWGSKLRHLYPNKEGTFSGWLRKWVKGFIGLQSRSTDDVSHK